MNELQKAIGRVRQRIQDRMMGNGLMQEENEASGERHVTPGIGELIRQAGAESCVLLKNDGTLPLDPSRETAVFGRCQRNWFYVGYGSGGNVHAPYFVGFMEGLDNAGAAYNKALAETYKTWTEAEENRVDHGWWGHWPMSYPEMPVTAELAEEAARTADAALVILGRAAGEERENVLEKGSYYLTDEERAMLDAVTAAFSKVVVVLNVGSILDMAWIEEYGDRLSAVLLVWQGGMESGNAAADVLYGKVSPSGRLADTIARAYEDYPSAAHFGGKEYNEYAEGVFVGYRHFDTYAPERVLYPFGFGLSYTSFGVKPVLFARREGGVSVTVEVTNTGACPGKEVVQLWCAAPAGSVPKPARVLAAFAKTKELAPGETETVTLSCGDKYLASFDETRRAFVLEAGAYVFTANGAEAGRFELDEAAVVEECEPACTKDVDLKQRILDRLPEEIPVTGDKGIKLIDVAEGRASLEDFIAQLTDDELEALTRGEGMMNSAQGVVGNAGAFGGVIQSLRDKGVAPVITSDGPAGLRLQKYASLCPCGTALACTWNTGLAEELYHKVGEEMSYYGVDVLLAPGMNIHRNPLCGRNFEYFSEDPVLSGKTAAAITRGIQSAGHACCPKHFACNNQEYKRNINDSRVPERALREIYLRNFEICVKEAAPKTVMTSYNKINGVWSHYNYDLATTVLRGEWGFGGTVITDWWMQKSRSPEFPRLRNNAYRVRAQVDMLMPGDMGHLAKAYKADGTLRKTLGQPEGITRGELQRTAKNVLKLVLDLKY